MVWQRRALQAELGTTDAVVQISLEMLKRFSSAQSTSSSPVVSFIVTASPMGGTTHFLPPGTQWGHSRTTRSASISNLTFTALDTDDEGKVCARWTVTFDGTDETITSYGKTLHGGIRGNSPLGELVQQYEGLYGRHGLGLIASFSGKPAVTMSYTSKKSWNATAILVTPLTADVRMDNGAISITASPSGATISSLSSTSFDLSNAANLQNQLTARLNSLLLGRIPRLCPDISMVGTIPISESVAEALPIYALIRIASTQSTTALAVFISAKNGATLPSASTDLTYGADCAYIIRESVFQTTLAFCFRTDRFPRHWHTNVVLEPLSDQKTNVRIVFSIDISNASISLAPVTPNSARQEDRADLFLTMNSKIIDVLNEDGSAASDEIRNQITADKTIDYIIDLYFSNVSMPGINTDAQTEAWLQLWRSQVSRRFSVPFISVTGSTLLERALNGLEKVMLSRANITF